MDNRSRTADILLLCSLCVFLLTAAWAQGRSSSLYGSTVRLHVLAVDESEYEQSIKLNVRDKVLECITPLLSGVKESQEAENIIAENLSCIAEAAGSASMGRRVSVSLSDEFYPTRDYEGFTLPAGRYKSLKVTLGEGKGHNWWCVVYPPLCMGLSEGEELSEYLSGGDVRLITEGEGVQFRLKIVEIWENIVASRIGLDYNPLIKN